FLLKGTSLGLSLAVLLGSSTAFANHDSPTSPSGTASTTTTTTTTTTPVPLPSPSTTTGPSTSPTTTISGQRRFTCQLNNGQYTVMYNPESQPNQAYAWATPSTLGGGWSADRRCSEISRRLESYRPDGLVEMQTGVENGYNVICVTTERVPGCRIVLTVPPGQDPVLTRDRVFENLTIADSGQQTQGVNTFVGSGSNDPILGNLANLGNSILGTGSNPLAPRRSGNINLRPFLDRADGGTGSKLRNSNAVRSNPRLNPNKFR
ncbi:MAG: COP23 domain-containing protein, partial [Leptolyngbyaceae bacterium]|nr:COP23 domain-containing protein [Leptolyngbyaceae bacterium]